MNDHAGDRDSSHSESSEALRVRVLNLQTAAWERGSAISVEQLLLQFPQLTEESEAVLDLLHNEIYCRRRSGQQPELEEYLNRFPHVAEKVKIQWEVDRLLFDDSMADLNETRNSEGTLSGERFLARHEVPEILGSYKILELLGQGGMGAVYKAHHIHLGKIVALKILSHRVTERSASVARFRREMKAVGALIHPNIVQAFDAGEVNGIHYIAMELIEDIDLHRLVKEQGPLSVGAACTAVWQLASALAAAHGVGVIHRDVKPSNMMVSNGQIKLLDLGLARLVEEEGPVSDLTSATQTFGTPDFMAPEQWDDARFVDHRADLYSVGCTLFFLLVGRPPYGTHTFPTAARKMKAHLLEPIPDLHAARADVPRHIIKIYKRLMAKDPQDRFATADQLREEIAPDIVENAFAGVAANWNKIPPKAPQPESAPPTLPHYLPHEKSPANRLPRLRSRRLRHLAIAAALSVTALIAGLALRSSTNKAPEVANLPISPASTPPATQQEPAAPATDETPATLLPTPPGGGNLQLWKLITRDAVADGLFEDVNTTDDLVELDTTGLSKQLWVNFLQYQSSDVSADLSLRVTNPKAQGFFKLVMLPLGQWHSEYYFQIRTLDGRTTMNISYHDQYGQQVLIERPLELKDEFYDIKLNFGKSLITASVQGHPAMEAPRKFAPASTTAIAVSGWKVELKRPTVVAR